MADPVELSMLEEVISRLLELGNRGGKVLTKADLAAVLMIRAPRSLDAFLRRLVALGVLQRAARGVYVNCLSSSGNRYLIEEIACVLRRGHFNYVSLESILSEFGVISQIMMSRITIMTTGCSGVFNTPYGTIEFTHTKRSLDDLRGRTVSLEGRPLHLATKKAGVADLRRVGRNTNMIDQDELDSLEIGD